MRDRLVLPLLLPVLTVGAILLTIFSFGHLLLRVFESSALVSRAIAIGAAALILLVASVLANRPVIKSGWWVYPATALPAAVILASGLFYFIRPAEKNGAGGAEVAVIAAPGPLEEIATDNKFSSTAFSIVAGAQYTLNFANNGSALHNWRLKGVLGADGKDVQTQIIAGGKTETVSFTVPQPGTYDFVCDVHPTEMMGKLTVVPEGTAAGPPGGASAAGTNPGPAQIVEIATDNKFAVTQLSAFANTPTPLTLQNKGSAIHNIRLQVKDINGTEPQTKLLPGGQSETIQFTVAVPGTYDFICDVHPNEMKGKITIQ